MSGRNKGNINENIYKIVLIGNLFLPLKI